jgi:hypothetical protein
MKTHPVPLRRHFLSAALLGLLLSVHAPAADQTATWNGTTGIWSDFTRWSTNPLFPNNGNGGLTFDAVQSTGTITVDQAITIQKLTMSGGTNTGAGFTLTTNELFTFQGGGTLNGTGTVQADGGVAFGVGNTTLSGGRTLNLGGNSTWSAGAIQFFDNSVLTNQAGSTFTTSFNGTMSGGSAGGTFNNAGTFTKSAGTLTTILVTANNTGTISVESGTVSLNAGGTHSGIFSPDAGATLRFGGGTHILEAGTSLTGSGTVQLSAGTLTLNSAVSSASDTTFTLSAGTLNGPGALTLNGPLNWTGGSMDGVSTVQANGNATFSGGNRNLSGGRTLNLGGSTDWTAGVIQFSDNSVLTNQAGATLTTNFNGSLSGGSAEGSFTNAGTFTKNGGSGNTSIQSAFSNTGTVNVSSAARSLLSGTVTQHSGTTLTGGTWNVTNGASINIATGSNITTIGSAASVTLDGAGSSFAKVTTALNNNQGNFTLKNNRDLTTAGAFTNSGKVTVQDSTTTMTIGAGGSASYTQTAGNTVLVNGAMIDASAFNLNGGTLSGNGTIDAPLTTSGSTIIGPGASPGALVINGNTILGAGNTLAMEIGGLTPGIEHDLITVNGTLTLDGALMIKFFGGYETALTMGSIFEIVTSNAPVQSMFSNVASGSQIWDFDHHHLFEVWYGASSMFGTNNVVLFALTPEPSRGILLLAGAFSFILRRRRK